MKLNDLDSARPVLLECQSCRSELILTRRELSAGHGGDIDVEAAILIQPCPHCGNTGLLRRRAGPPEAILKRINQKPAPIEDVALAWLLRQCPTVRAECKACGAFQFVYLPPITMAHKETTTLREIGQSIPCMWCDEKGALKFMEIRYH